MNIRKNIDYSTMFDTMQIAMSADMSQMKLYCELGRLICQRTEKGAAVAAAEYLQRTYPDVPGLSPRNLRRMRNFYRMYEGNSELLDLAMGIGWTQNVVILEADLSMEERRWYLCAVKQFGWTKSELQQKIESHIYQEIHLDESESECYTEIRNDNNVPAANKNRSVTPSSKCLFFYQNQQDWKFGLFIYSAGYPHMVTIALGNYPDSSQTTSAEISIIDRHGLRQYVKCIPIFPQQLSSQNALTNGFYPLFLLGKHFFMHLRFPPTWCDLKLSYKLLMVVWVLPFAFSNSYHFPIATECNRAYHNNCMLPQCINPYCCSIVCILSCSLCSYSIRLNLLDISNMRTKFSFIFFIFLAFFLFLL